MDVTLKMGLLGAFSYAYGIVLLASITLTLNKMLFMANMFAKMVNIIFNMFNVKKCKYMLCSKSKCTGNNYMTFIGTIIDST